MTEPVKGYRVLDYEEEISLLRALDYEEEDEEFEEFQEEFLFLPGNGVFVSPYFAVKHEWDNAPVPALCGNIDAGLEVVRCTECDCFSPGDLLPKGVYTSFLHSEGLGLFDYEHPIKDNPSETHSSYVYVRLRPHDIPSADCTCGYHAFYTFEDARNACKEVFRENIIRCVAYVEGYGTVIKDKRDFRAQYMRVIAIAPVEEYPPDDMVELAKKIGAEVCDLERLSKLA